MRIAFCYPPFSENGRFPNLSQNRQFIYTASKAVKLYPVVMATAATRLSSLGHEVLWLDGITRRLDREIYEENLSSFSPGLIVLEAKAPIMKKLWKYVNKIKKNKKIKIILVGDHVSYFPKESFQNSKVDFILTGGDYDFLLVNLIKHLEKGERLEPGIWYRKKVQSSKFKVQSSGEFKLNHNLNETPMIDRKLTRWQDYGEAYLFHPCAYMMFGRGCGIKDKKTGACTFCIWQHALWRCSARLRSPEHVVAEVKNLIRLEVKEIFDDTESGALWDYQWLKEFYRLLKKEKILGKISFSSNARGDQLDKKTSRLLNKLGYRLLKIGLESGVNETLAKIGKKEKIEDIIQGVKSAKDVELRVMLTVMVGYPWETEEEAQKTYGVTRGLTLYKTRAGDCLQASVIVPYPGTPLWWQAKKKGWLLVAPDDYEKFDMSQPVLKTEIDARKWCNKVWSIQKSPQFILKSGLTTKNISEAVLLLRGARSLLEHIKDYVRTDE
ncbi:MAG TPA: radical SAM protein [Nevskiaceae bacterium]|nr:radical SAM protein [Nevskiaceae bacterium]